MAWVKIWAASAAAMALAVPASAAGYLKIPDIDGESKPAGDGVETEDIGFTAKGEAASGTEQHYYTIRLEDATVSDAKGSKTVAPVRWMAPESIREGTRDAATGRATGKRQHKAVTLAKDDEKASSQRMRASTATTSAGGSGGGKAKVGDLVMVKYVDTVSYTPPKDRSGPGTVQIAASLPGCRVGQRFSHVLIGEDGGEEVRLGDVQVSQCASETVTITYEVIQRPV
ncbi:hypothetical protein [Altererythrobacter lutimaris]|uniref:Peptidylprolyl isomerase n=1 Tax=Altererythrobacter lutimaris TaxID=2743979 RepID=A0A850H8J8_9SPHN|nr:hypothetical protein [Altererythrobacter lutimaris]NVE94109.1 hypothetical protein [Altererythrobacter lutimaris]